MRQLQLHQYQLCNYQEFCLPHALDKNSINNKSTMISAYHI